MNTIQCIQIHAQTLHVQYVCGVVVVIVSFATEMAIAQKQKQTKKQSNE